MPRSGAPGSGLLGLVGQGIGMAAEYREHRKQVKLSRENSQQSNNSENAAPGPSTRPQQSARGLSSSSDSPPAYAESAAGESGERSLASGAPASSDKKAALSQYDSDDEDDEDEGDDVETSGDEDEDVDVEMIEDDEEDWQLDEALERERAGSDSPPSYDESEADPQDTQTLVRNVMMTERSSDPRSQPQVYQPLPVPVIIPQRRPRKKTRGFVRAYAPLLGQCSGIDQTTFLAFLKNFHKASQASAIFPIIEVSTAIAGFAPSVIAMAVTTVVQVGAQVGEAIQTRQRTNSFLDRMNEELFKPRGLYAMIIKYKPDADVGNPSSMTDIGSRFGLRPQVVDLNTNQTIAKYDRSLSEERGFSAKMKGLRLASGTTQGRFALPEAAPLIFPYVDEAIAQGDGKETFKDKTKDAKKFMAQYLDRRAQMQYARDDPDSILALPEEQRGFRSQYSDPNHPMYTGGLVGFVSGGKLNLRALQAEQRADNRFYKDSRRALMYERRMDQGRALSGKRQARYDAFVEEADRRGDRRLSSGRGFGGYDRGLSGYNDEYGDGGGGAAGGRRRRRRGGRGNQRGGLISSLIGAAVNAANSGKQPASNPPAPYGASSAPYGRHSSQRPYEYEDSYPDRYDGSQPYAQRRSLDDRAPPPPPRQLDDRGRRARQAPQQNSGGSTGIIRRLMRQDVLYLMIVNMPSQAELAEARRQLGR